MPYPSLAARLRLALGTARTRARFAVFVGVFVFANLAGMSSAFGDGEGNSGGSSVWRWMDVEDSDGNSAWGYSMSLDYGGITDVGNAVFGGVTGLCWFFYQWFVIASIWLINFALDMEWFDPLREPASDIAAGLQEVLAQAGLVPLLLVITAVTAGLLIMRGAWATAIFEVVVALVVLSLGTGVFEDPVDQTIGATGSAQKVVDSSEGSGWLAQANSAGLELAGGLQSAGTGGAGRFSEPGVVREDISGQLVDTFLRTPHQLINYGKVLDGTECEGAYNRSLNGGAPPQPSYVTGDPLDDGVDIDSSEVPSEGEDGWADWKAYRDWITMGNPEHIEDLQNDIESTDTAEFGWTDGGNVGGDNPLKMEPREIVADCDEAAGERAENPSPGMAGDAATMGFGVVFLVGLAALLAFTLIFLGVEFLWCALRSIWDFVIGLLPGRSRHTLWQTLSTAVWCLIGVAFTSIFLVTYLLILNAVARSFGGGGDIMGAFALVDILMLVGLILFWRLRKRMKSAAARTAALMAKRPNPKGGAGMAGSPAKMPAANGGAAAGGLAAGAATGGRRALKIGKATAAGTAAASGLGATGVGRAARVGGAMGSGGVLLGVGVPFAVGRKMNPWRRDRAAFGAAQGQFEKADAAAQTASATNGDAQAAAGANGRPRPHRSREAFADARGLRSPNGRPQSSRRVALGEQLQNAQSRTLAEQMTSPEDGGPQFKRVVSKSGVVTFEPVDKVTKPSQPRPTTASHSGAGTAKGGKGTAVRDAIVGQVRRRTTPGRLAASVATAGFAAQASAPVMSGPEQYVAGVAVSGAGAVMAWRAAD